MQPVLWQPPVELSESEEHIVKRIRRAKLFVFLRHYRHELLDEVLQRELAGLYRTSKRGQPPIAPAQLALAIIALKMRWLAEQVHRFIIQPRMIPLVWRSPLPLLN